MKAQSSESLKARRTGKLRTGKTEEVAEGSSGFSRTWCCAVAPLAWERSLLGDASISAAPVARCETVHLLQGLVHASALCIAQSQGYLRIRSQNSLKSILPS